FREALLGGELCESGHKLTVHAARSPSYSSCFRRQKKWVVTHFIGRRRRTGRARVLCNYTTARDPFRSAARIRSSVLAFPAGGTPRSADETSVAVYPRAWSAAAASSSIGSALGRAPSLTRATLPRRSTIKRSAVFFPTPGARASAAASPAAIAAARSAGRE